MELYMMRKSIFGILILSVIITCASAKTYAEDSSDYFLELLSSAYQTRDKEKICSIIEELESLYADNGLIHSYYINIAQLYHRIGEDSQAVKSLNSEPTVIKFFYLGTLQMKMNQYELGKKNLEIFNTEIIKMTEEGKGSVDPKIIILTQKLLGYEAPLLAEESDQTGILYSMSIEEIIDSVWPSPILP